MKILAVSDEPSRSLETLVNDSPEKYADVNLVVSCGDLDRSYVEFLADRLKKELFFVSGNHPGELDYDEDLVTKKEPVIMYINGRADLHGRAAAYKDYIVAGFGGSAWYNGEYNQYTEQQMSRVVKTVERKIAWHRLQDKLLGRKPKEVIVVSHAPVLGIHDLSDRPHRGFKCFKKFIDKISPLLWLHGHVHLPNQFTSQITVVGSTTVVNAFGCKIIEIHSKKIHVTSHCN